MACRLALSTTRALLTWAATAEVWEGGLGVPGAFWTLHALDIPTSFTARERTRMSAEREPPSFDFEAVVAEHGPYLWRVLRRLGVHAADVEDVWQETFLVVHRKLEGFEGRS